MLACQRHMFSLYCLCSSSYRFFLLKNNFNDFEPKSKSLLMSQVLIPNWDQCILWAWLLSYGSKARHFICDAKTEAKLKMPDIRTFQILGWKLVNLILIARLQSKVWLLKWTYKCKFSWLKWIFYWKLGFWPKQPVTTHDQWSGAGDNVRSSDPSWLLSTPLWVGRTREGWKIPKES